MNIVIDKLLKKLLCLTLLLGLLTWPFGSYAQVVEEVRALSFGTVAVLHNTTSGRINIDELGNVQMSSHFAVISPPQFGILRLMDFPANAQLFVNGVVLQSQMTSTPLSPEGFVLNAINTTSVININSDGTEEVRFGGEIITSGSGSRNFADTQYSSSVSITFNY